MMGLPDLVWPPGSPTTPCLMRASQSLMLTLSSAACWRLLEDREAALEPDRDGGLEAARDPGLDITSLQFSQTVDNWKVYSDMESLVAALTSVTTG